MRNCPNSDDTPNQTALQRTVTNKPASGKLKYEESKLLTMQRSKGLRYDRTSRKSTDLHSRKSLSRINGMIAGTALVMLLGACGGGGDQTEVAATAPTSPPAASPAASPAAVARDQPYNDNVVYDMTAGGNIASLDEGAAVTHHEVKLRGKTLRYTAKVGHLVARDTQTDEPQASMSYVAFTLDGEAPGKRPVTFLFNGGPGSPAQTLLMGSFAPKRVRTSTPLPTPLGPYTLEDNRETLLDQTDLVFLDPPGTGWSSAIAPKTNADFWNADADVKVDSEFVMRYLKVNGRTQSPVVIFGESYGGPRAAMMSYYLQNKVRQPLAGAVLFSPALNHYGDEVATNVTDPFFPTAAITAWYHSQNRSDADSIVSPENKRKGLEQFRAEVIALNRNPAIAAMYKEWAPYGRFSGLLRIVSDSSSYPGVATRIRSIADLCTRFDGNSSALGVQFNAKNCTGAAWATVFGPDIAMLDGRKLTALARSDSPAGIMTGSLTANPGISAQIKTYAGAKALDISFAPLSTGLVLDPAKFANQLIPNTVLGQYDSRTTNTSAVKQIVGNYLLYDPAVGDIDPVYSTSRATYVHDTLKYSTSSLYQGHGGDGIQTNWTANPKHVDPSGNTNRINSLPDLQQALIDNPKFKVLAQSGYYDTVTPFFQTQMDIESLVLPVNLKANVFSRYFEAGHMGYADDKARLTIRADLDAFYKSVLGNAAQ